MTLRDVIVANALWGADNEPQIHYSETDRWGALHTPRALPMSADCSSFVTCCYAWAGAPDPNGQGYDGQGYTGTLLGHLPQIPITQAQPGDLIVYGPDPGDHVTLIVEPGTDPLVVSHGQEAGPIRVRHSVEARAHRDPVRVLAGLAADPTPVPTPSEDDMADPEVLAALQGIRDAINNNNQLLSQINGALGNQDVGVLKQLVDIQNEIRAKP